MDHYGGGPYTYKESTGNTSELSPTASSQLCASERALEGGEIR